MTHTKGSIDWGTTQTNCPEIGERGVGDPCIAAAECDLIRSDGNVCKICAASLERPFDEEQRDNKGARGLGPACSRLEVGIGSGLNLPFYSAEVRRAYGV